MTITPNPVPDDRPERTRYDWAGIQLGVWQNWLTVAEDITDDEALRRATRVRLAARDYAQRHGMQLESRRLDHGRVLDLRFSADQCPECGHHPWPGRHGTEPGGKCGAPGHDLCGCRYVL